MQRPRRRDDRRPCGIVVGAARVLDPTTLDPANLDLITAEILGHTPMSAATLTISSRNYSSWSLRGWLICRMSGLDFETELLSRHRRLHPRRTPSPVAVVPRAAAAARRHLGLGHARHRSVSQRDPARRPASCRRTSAARAHCRSVSGEMHGGFINLRSALPMNLKARHTDFKIFGGAGGDIERIITIWRGMPRPLRRPYLFGDRPTLADAMYAPVCTRFLTYDVPLPPGSRPTATTSSHGRSWRNGRSGARRAGRDRRTRHGILTAAAGSGRGVGGIRPGNR